MRSHLDVLSQQEGGKRVTLKMTPAETLCHVGGQKGATSLSLHPNATRCALQSTQEFCENINPVLYGSIKATTTNLIVGPNQ